MAGSEAKQTQRAAKKARREAKLRRRPWLWHAVNAWDHFKSHNGTQYSAALTYFSFLALFPLLLLGASVAGFVLSNDQHLQQELFDKIAQNIPGDLGQKLTSSIKSAISNRTGVGIVGLAGVLLTGLGWVNNLRQAIDAVAGKAPEQQNFLVGRVRNLFVLAGLGLGVLVSLGLTVVGTAVTDQLVRSVGLAHVTGIALVLKAAGIVLSVLGDVLIFWWVLVRLPALPVTRGVALRGVLLAAVGLEVLKIVGTYTVARSSHSPTLGPFASLLAVLIWIELVSRFLLYCVAWMTSNQDPARSVEPAEAEDEAPVPPAGAAWLVGVGAAAGAAVVLTLKDRSRPSRAD